MTRFRFRPTPALVTALALALGCGQREADPAAGNGEAEITSRPAPEFALATLDGDSLRLADLDDFDVVLMNFWASWCAPCKAEMPDLMALHETYGPDGFTVLGVTVNDVPRDSREFADDIGLNYPSAIGTPEMLEAYGLSPWLPTSLLVVDGEITREWIGPRTRDEFEYAVRVGLGKAPPMADVLRDPAGEDPGGE